MAQTPDQATTTIMEQPVPVEASAAAASGEDERLDDRPNTIHTYSLLYRFLPTGSCTLVFGHGNNTNEIQVQCSSCLCQGDRRVASAESLQVRRQSVCHCWRLTRDAILSFVLAFLFHLLPSIVWGAENSLGSPSNHQLMGVVWFLGWPIWFAVMQVIWRPWGIQINTTSDKGSSSSLFVPFDSWQHATDVVDWWQNKKNNGDPVPPRPRSLVADPWFLFGWIFSLILVINMFVTGVLVVQCNERGCCKDDETTLECCVETGYPEC